MTHEQNTEQEQPALPVEFSTVNHTFRTNVFTIGLVMRIKKELQIDIFKDDLQRLMEFRDQDPEKWLNFLSVVLQRQIVEAGLTAETFAEEFAGPAYFQSYQAILGGLVDFFRTAGMAERAISLVKSHLLATKAMAAVLQKMESLDMESTILNQINGLDLQSEIENGLKKNFQNLAGEISSALSDGSVSPAGKT
ncbi:MAG: hypothetical protein CMJ46_16205 [Planctomyces sp.]|nr:hypothetical protein [Planctomyces sp.]